MSRKTHYPPLTALMGTSTRHLFYIASLALLFHSAIANIACYFPDGVTLDPDGYPCNTSATASHCCRTFEACLTGGACYTQFDSVIYRRRCTDKTFKDAACPRPCLNSKFPIHASFSCLFLPFNSLHKQERNISATPSGSLSLLSKLMQFQFSSRVQRPHRPPPMRQQP
jgi:hypothetical protein